MAGPWEQYATPAPAPAASAEGPWSRYSAPAEPSVSQRIGGLVRRFGMGTRDVIEGAASVPGMAYDAVGAGINAATGALEWAGGPSLPRVNSASQNLGSVLDATGLPAPATDNERLASAVNRGVAGLIPTMGAGAALQAAGRAPAVAEALLQAPVSQVAAAGAGSAASEVAGQNGAGPMGQMAAGLTGGLAGAAGVAGARRLITPVARNVSPEQARLVDVARAEGIPLSAGQETGSKPLRTMESVFGEMPMTAGPQARIDEAQRVAFNRAALSRSGTGADRATPDVLTGARTRIGGTIGEIANRNTLQVTPALEARLAQVEDSLRFIPAEAAGPVRARIEQLRGMMIDPPAPPPGTVAATDATTRTIPGASYRMMDSQLGRSIRGTDNGDLRSALGDLRGTLREAMDASISPGDAADWQQARRQYANLMNVANAMRPGAAGADVGNISPSALAQALNQSTGRGYAFGQGDMNDLARVGTAFVKPSTPNSGTQQRTMIANIVQGGLGGGGLGYASGGDPLVGALLGAGALAAPRGVQAAYNTDAVRRYLTNQLTQPSQATALNPGIVAALLADQERPRQPPR